MRKTFLWFLLPAALCGQARVLLIGDSISAGYEGEVRKLLAGKAEVVRFGPIGGPTTAGLDNWAKLQGKWDVVHFNWGLHDIKINPDGTHQVPMEQYEKNLSELVTRLKATGARLIWATTTPVPDGQQAPPRKRGDEVAYNAAARKIMDASGIAVDDLYSVALSRIGEIQRPRNVHYTDAGYAFLATQVAGSILRRLPETEARLKSRLEWFQDLKFGFMMHWGAYSQMGCIESWPLVWADRKWGNPPIQTREQMTDFRRRYFALGSTFSPTAFDPRAWAAAAEDAGMKYVVFTTKHHDGFAMFDTKQTDYKASRDYVRDIFDAFRARGFGIGAYFSKSDWHHPDYWSPEMFPEDRNPNYDTLAQPEKWGRFRDFVHGQVRELTTGYGKVDILWLDGGQVRPPKQDLQMDRLAAMARGNQPDLIIVNRTARDAYEDYRTPEQEVPKEPPSFVWESCITMGKQWSYKPDDQYKSTRDLIRLLVDIVAKGGNLLLNVGPGPDGRLPETALQRMKEIGAWMKVNGEAIYGTRSIAPYRTGEFAFTRKGSTLYAIYLPSSPGAALEFTGLPLHARAKAELLGGGKVRWRKAGDRIVLETPEKREAIVIRFTGAL